MSLYLASLLMLSMRHIDANLIKQLSRLDKVSQLGVKGSEKDDLVLFMLSCLYFAGAGHTDFNILEQKAELLNIKLAYSAQLSAITIFLNNPHNICRIPSAALI